MKVMLALLFSFYLLAQESVEVEPKPPVVEVIIRSELDQDKQPEMGNLFAIEAQISDSKQVHRLFALKGKKIFDALFVFNVQMLTQDKVKMNVVGSKELELGQTQELDQHSVILKMINQDITISSNKELAQAKELEIAEQPWKKPFNKLLWSLIGGGIVLLLISLIPLGVKKYYTYKNYKRDKEAYLSRVKNYKSLLNELSSREKLEEIYKIRESLSEDLTLGKVNLDRYCIELNKYQFKPEWTQDELAQMSDLGHKLKQKMEFNRYDGV